MGDSGKSVLFLTGSYKGLSNNGVKFCSPKYKGFKRILNSPSLPKKNPRSKTNKSSATPGAEWVLLNAECVQDGPGGCEFSPLLKMFWVVAILSDKGMGLELKVSWKILDILMWWSFRFKARSLSLSRSRWGKLGTPGLDWLWEAGRLTRFRARAGTSKPDGGAFHFRFFATL